MVEVFKTNIQTEEQADNIMQILLALFPMAKICFDLEDCDKILRFEHTNFTIDLVKETLKNAGFQCEILV